MTKNRSITVCAIVSLVVGYVLGLVIGVPEVDSSLLSGDIGKVSKYNKQVSEDVKAFQERLASDSLFRQEAVQVIATMDARIGLFRELTESTTRIAGGVKELENSVQAIAAMKEFAEGAKAQADTTLLALDALLQDKDNATQYDYEQLAQNTLVAYLIMDKQNDAVREFVNQVDAYVGRRNAPVEGLAELRDNWVVFSAQGAVVNGSKSEIAYWQDKGVLVETDNLGKTGYDVNVKSFLGTNTSLAWFPIISSHDIRLGRVMNQQTLGSTFRPRTVNLQTLGNMLGYKPLEKKR